MKMAVKMRLTRLGSKKAPTYRVVVCDERKARDGEYIESVGHYNPRSKECVLNAEIAKKWLACGVQPTETVKSLLVKNGIIEKSSKLSPSRTKVKKENK